MRALFIVRWVAPRLGMTNHEFVAYGRSHGINQARPQKIPLMSFVSSEFVVFYVIVFVVYYAIPVLRVQNLLIVAGSYIFYGWWDWRFLPLLLGISLTNYATA